MSIGQIMAECDCQHTACSSRGYCMATRIAKLEAENAQLRALLNAHDAWARGEPSRPPRAALDKGD